jgi:hypothetical protein
MTKQKPSAPALSPAMQEIADTYPRGKFDASLVWQSTTVYVHALMKQGIEHSKLVAQATLYRRQCAALKTIGTDQVMDPIVFFGTDEWQGPFPIPYVKDEAEIEAGLTNEQWLKSKYAKQ